MTDLKPKPKKPKVLAVKRPPKLETNNQDLGVGGSNEPKPISEQDSAEIPPKETLLESVAQSTTNPPPHPPLPPGLPDIGSKIQLIAPWGEYASAEIVGFYLPGLDRCLQSSSRWRVGRGGIGRGG